MKVKRMRYLSFKIYNTLHCLNPQYMNKLFQLNGSKHSSRGPLDLIVPRVNQARYGSTSIRYEGAKIWNHPPTSIKSTENLDACKYSSKHGKIPAATAIFANLFFQIQILSRFIFILDTFIKYLL